MSSLAVVNLSRLNKNVSTIKKGLKKGVKFCAVVKSNAYGHGLVDVARSIEKNVDYFAVSFLDEALQLRYAGIMKPILILIPISDQELKVASRYDISVCVQSISQITWAVNEKLYLKIHIAVNSGMNRLGIDSVSQLNRIIKVIKNSSVRFQGIFSHFISGDRLRCKKQVERFKPFIDIAKNFSCNVLVHICSSGSVNLTEYNFDMVRVGIMMYGYHPSKEKMKDIKPCMSIYAKKLCDRRLKAGENLLYGDYNLQKDAKISIIKYGYADGGDRSKGKDFNNRCMDMSAVKKCGEYYLVFNDANRVAKELSTISYDVLVKYSVRCKYIYEDNCRQKQGEKTFRFRRG